MLDAVVDVRTSFAIIDRKEYYTMKLVELVQCVFSKNFAVEAV